MQTLSQRPTIPFILLMGLLTALGAISIDLYLPAMPTIAAQYGQPAAAAQATLSSFLAGMAIGQLVIGPMSDRIGRRLPLLAGTLLFVLASVAITYSTSLEQVIAGRFIQALGACAGVVISRAIIRDLYDTTESARLFSLCYLVLSVAPLFAPTIGGMMLVHIGWEVIFMVLASYGLIILGWVYFGQPETRTEATAKLAASESPWSAYKNSLKDRTVLGFLIAGSLSSGAVFAYLGAAPALFIEFYQQPASRFGLIFGFNAFGLIAATQVNRQVLKYHSPETVSKWGLMSGAAFAIILLGLSIIGWTPFYVVVGMLFLILGSIGFVSANASALALGAMPQRSGTISALTGAAAFMAGAIISMATAPFAAQGPLGMAAAMSILMVISIYSLRLATHKN